MTQNKETIVIRRKRVSFRAGHRGTREMDFLLGSYARDHIDTMDEKALDRLETLMDVDDQTLYRWVSGAIEVPAEFDTDIMADLKKIKFTQRNFA